METNLALNQSVLDDLLRIRKWAFFIVIVLFAAAFSYYINLRYATEEILVNTYGEQLTLERIDRMLETGKRMQFITYLFVPLIIIVRICYNTVFVAAGNFISENHLHVSDIYNACMKAEIVFMAMTLVRLLFIEFFQHVHDLNDLNMIPFSVAQLLNGSGLPKWLLQPLSYINVFEAAYVLLLAGFLSRYNGKGYGHNLRFSLAAYGAGLLLWCIIIAYLTLMVS